jgi:hypothetical protein
MLAQFTTDGSVVANGFSIAWVAVAGPNPPPTDVTIDATTVNENSGASTVIGTLTMVDVGDTPTFSVPVGSPFAISGSFLVVRSG